MIKTCQNCGRAHEGRLIEEFKDGDNKPIEIVVCEHIAAGEEEVNRGRKGERRKER